MFSQEERLKYAYAFMRFNEKDLNLDFWQEQYLKTAARFTILVKSRRTGFSFITALKGVVKAMDADRVAYTKQFVSYNESDAIEKINYAAHFYESMPKGAKKKCVVNNKTELDFVDRNGKTISRLISIPCRPPRGKGGDICLDEFHIYLPKMSDAVYTAALPVISRGGCIEMGSTPLGKIGKFYEIYSDKKSYPSYERYNIPWWFSSGLCSDVEGALRSAPGMRTEERVKAYGTEIIREIFNSLETDKFQQEYECRFVDEEASYIPLELIFANTPGRDTDDKIIEMAKDGRIADEEYWQYDRNEDFQTYSSAGEAILNYRPELHGSPLFFGYDVGRYHDRIAMYIIGMAGGKKRGFMRLELRNVEFEAQQDIVMKLFQNLPIHRGAMDSTGIGKETFERLHKRLGDRLIGVDFSAMMKETLAINVKRGLENGEFMLENSKDFHAQIHSIKRTAGVGKYFRYDAERNDKGHADSFWAWALAAWAADGGRRGGNFYREYAEKKRRDAGGGAEGEGQRAGAAARGHSLQAVLRKIGRQ